MIKPITALIFLLSLQVHADDFKTLELKPQKIECSNKNQLIQFAGAKSAYTIYDKNSSAVKLLTCEKIKVNNLEFYTAHY